MKRLKVDSLSQYGLARARGIESSMFAFQLLLRNVINYGLISLIKCAKYSWEKAKIVKPRRNRIMLNELYHHFIIVNKTHEIYNQIVKLCRLHKSNYHKMTFYLHILWHFMLWLLCSFFFLSRCHRYCAVGTSAILYELNILLYKTTIKIIPY